MAMGKRGMDEDDQRQNSRDLSNEGSVGKENGRGLLKTVQEVVSTVGLCERELVCVEEGGGGWGWAGVGENGGELYETEIR